MRLNDPRFLGTPSDVVYCVGIGAVIGALVATGDAVHATRSLIRLGHSAGNPWLIGATEFLGACLAGALVGMLRPLTRRLPVAIAIGCLATFPIVAILDAIQRQVSYPPDQMHWTIDVVSAVIYGTLVALAVRLGIVSARLPNER